MVRLSAGDIDTALMLTVSPTLSIASDALDYLRVVDGDLDLDTRLDVDGRDLLDDVGGRVQVDQTLVDPHLKLVPCVGTLSVRGLTRHDSQLLRRQTHRALDRQL